MALFDSGIEMGTSVLVGIGAIILVPVVVPVVAAVAKPLVKAGIKGGILIYRKGREVMAEACEMVEDLTAEVSSELHQEHESPSPEGSVQA